jgi:hypothetical protein|uniref:Uncharacterized protein n=2 Tax=Picea TaxID=3328 RepID=A0A101LX04_PICGL|nr:hypothetical protein ABT39_MTgene6346 [Picea glauca]QHR91416.1 hypothetical protein Q903MT_gene5450 [Picea sitchensis]
MGLGSITPFTRMESFIIYPFAYTKGLIGPVINNLCLAYHSTWVGFFMVSASFHLEKRVFITGLSTFLYQVE